MPIPILFDEVLFDPDLIGSVGGQQPVTGGPELANTDIFNPGTGVHKVNVSRADAVRVFSVPVGLNSQAAREYFNNFWLGGQGSAVGFRFRVSFDYRAADEVFGEGDGAETEFPLYVTYTRPGVTARQDVRRITKPVTNTNVSGGVTLYEANGVAVRAHSTLPGSTYTTPFVIRINGSPTLDYVIDNTTGLVTFDSPPADGATLSWSGEYDTPMAFVGNSFQLEHNVTGKVPVLTMREILPAELGIYT
jgi:uncharacterized protein (TIGR02217 family)